MRYLLFVMLLVSAVFGERTSLYSVVEDATNSGVTKGSEIPEEERPKGFIIKHAKSDKIDDDDGDGVVNSVDECKDTPEGKVVNDDGCMKLIRLHVRFDFDKYEIKNRYKSEIDKAVDFLKKNPKLHTSIEGHTDAIGNHEYNQDLSELRANSVATALHESGIDLKRMLVRGFGETIPVASNKSKEGRAKNRRVDISFDKK